MPNSNSDSKILAYFLKSLSSQKFLEQKYVLVNVSYVRFMHCININGSGGLGYRKEPVVVCVV